MRRSLLCITLLSLGSCEPFAALQSPNDVSGTWVYYLSVPSYVVGGSSGPLLVLVLAETDASVSGSGVSYCRNDLCSAAPPETLTVIGTYQRPTVTLMLQHGTSCDFRTGYCSNPYTVTFTGTAIGRQMVGTVGYGTRWTFTRQ